MSNTATTLSTELLAGNSTEELASLATTTVSDDILNALFLVEANEVREAVAFNDATPNYLLHLLATDPSPEVRAAAAKNESTPPWVHAVIAGNENETQETRAISQAAMDADELDPPNEDGIVLGLGSVWADGSNNCFDDEEEIDLETVPFAAEVLTTAYQHSKGLRFDQIETPMDYFTIHPADAIQHCFEEGAFEFIAPPAQQTLREAMTFASEWKAWEQKNGSVH